MVKTRHIFILLLISVLIILSFATSVNAALVKVTDENLKSTLQKFISSSENEENYQINVENNEIKVTSNEENYVLNYNLTNKPVFTYEIEIQQGMSYDEFQKRIAGEAIPMLGYVAVANINGIDYKDSLTYFSLYLVHTLLSEPTTSSENNYYVIVDDINLSEGVTIKKDPTDTKTIYVSEFGNRVMEYVNSLYGEKQTIKDNDMLNSFEMTTEIKDATSTSCKLVTTLNVNTDADFSKIKGFAKQVEDEFNKNSSKNKKTTNNENAVADISVMPRTGKNQNVVSIILYAIITFAIIGIFTLIVTRRKE